MDNVAITAGSGTSVATDDVSGVHFQKIKIDGGGDGVSEPIAGTTANGIDVDVTRVQGTVTVDGSGVTQPVSHAALTELAAAIDTEVQCDIVGALPAGDNNIGNVDVVTLPALPAGTNNIGDVDVLTVPAPLSTTGGGTEATALRVTVANDSTGVLSVDDNGSTISIDDGAGSITVDNGGTFAVQESGSALTALQLIDDIVYTDDTSTHSTGASKGALIMAAATPTDGSVNANDIGAVAMTVDRKMHVSVQDSIPAGTNNIGDVDVLTLPALPAGTNNIGDVDVLTLPALPAGTNNIGDVDVLTVPADPFGANADAAVTAGATGSISAKLRSISRDIVANIVLATGANAIGKLAANSGVDIGDVDVTTVGTITPGTAVTSLGKAEDAIAGAGDVGVFALGVANEAQTSLAADGDYIAFAKDVKGNSMSVGNIAHDGVDAGCPVKTGGQARTTNPTAVADADRVNFIADKLGKQVVVGSIRDLKGDQATTITSSTAETTIITAGAAGVFHDLYGLVIANTSASVCEVTIRDATGGGTQRSIQVPANDTRGLMLPESGAIKQATAANNWTATCGTSVASIKITALYVKNT